MHRRTSGLVARHHGNSWDYIHTAIDDHSRLAHAEAPGDERGPTCARILERAAAHLASSGIVRSER